MNKLPFNKEKAYALIIGIGNREVDAPAMAITTKDAAWIRDELLYSDQFLEKNIYLINENATKENIINKLTLLVDNTITSPAEMVIVYFSGHGCVKNGNHYLVCSDTTNNAIENSALNGYDFVSMLRSINTDKMIVLLDCCHAGGVYKSIDVPFQEEVLQSKPNRVILSASHASQVSYLSKPLSIFTFAILEGLAGRFFKGDDTNVTIFNLAMYVRERVFQLSENKQQPQLNIIQNAQTSDFLIARYPNGEPRTLVFPEDFKLLDSQGKRIDLSNSPAEDKEFRVLMYSTELKKINSDIALAEESFENNKDGSLELRMRCSKEIVDLKKQRDQFIADVRSLFKSVREYKQVEQNETIVKVISFIEEGNIKEAIGLLNPNTLHDELEYARSEINDSLNYMETTRDKYTLLAKATKINLSGPDEVKKVRQYFEYAAANYNLYYTPKSYNRLLDLANFLNEYNFVAEAIEEYTKIKQTILNSPDSNEQNNVRLANISNALGDIYLKTNQISIAISFFHESMHYYRVMVRSVAVVIDMAHVTTKIIRCLGISGRTREQCRESLLFMEEIADEIDKISGEAEIEQHKSIIFHLTSNMVNFYLDNEDFDNAHLSSLSCSALFKEPDITGSKDYLPQLAQALSNEAYTSMFYYMYEDALVNFNRSLALYNDLSEYNPYQYAIDKILTLSRMGILYHQTKKYSEAKGNFEQSLDILALLYAIDNRYSLMTKAYVLEHYGNLEFDNRDFSKATTMYQEAIDIYSDPPSGDNAVFIPDLISLRIKLGNAYEKQNQHGEANKNLTRAIELLPDIKSGPGRGLRPSLLELLLSVSIRYKTVDTNRDRSLLIAKYVIWTAHNCFIFHSVYTVEYLLYTAYGILAYWKEKKEDWMMNVKKPENYSRNNYPFTWSYYIYGSFVYKSLGEELKVMIENARRTK